MADKDDPFGLSNDAGRTRIRPIKGAGPATPAQNRPSSGERAQPPTPPPQYTASPGGARPAYDPRAGAPSARIRHARANANPLIAAFSALLELAPELERASPPAQPSALRVRLQDNLIDARDAAVGMGITLSRADQAAWFVAALLDDLALNTPWGGNSDWPRQPLVVALSGDVDAGTRFFERVEELARNTNRDPQMLELAYICVGLGFRGKRRIESGGGETALMALRSQIARALRNVDQDQAPLSPHWQGLDVPDERRRFVIPLWTIGLGAVALTVAAHVGLGIQLSTKAEQLYSLASLIPPPERAEIFRTVHDTAAPAADGMTTPPPPPPVVVVPVVMELVPLFTAKAPPNLVSALSGHEDAALAILDVQGTDPELFRSAKADVNDVYQPLIAALAQVIIDNADVIGRVTVIGHTDNVPVQKSNPFQSNQGLSEARAATIAGLLVKNGVDAALVTSEGHADLEPVGDNATKAGRAQNRRIEIKIEKKI